MQQNCRLPFDPQVLSRHAAAQRLERRKPMTTWREKKMITGSNSLFPLDASVRPPSTDT